MNKFLITIAIGSLFFVSCNSSKDKASNNSIQSEAKGGKFYGGVFRVNESDYIKNLFPLNITDAISYRVASQVYEGLMKFNQSDLEFKKLPCR